MDLKPFLTCLEFKKNISTKEKKNRAAFSVPLSPHQERPLHFLCVWVFNSFFEQPVLSCAKQAGAYSAYEHPADLLTTLKPALTHCDAAPVLRFPFERSCAERSGFPAGGEVQSKGYLMLAIHPMTLDSISTLQKSDGVQSPQSDYSIKDIIKRLQSQVWDKI